MTYTVEFLDCATTASGSDITCTDFQYLKILDAIPDEKKINKIKRYAMVKNNLCAKRGVRNYKNMTLRSKRSGWV